MLGPVVRSAWLRALLLALLLILPAAAAEEGPDIHFWIIENTRLEDGRPRTSILFLYHRTTNQDGSTHSMHILNYVEAPGFQAFLPSLEVLTQNRTESLRPSRLDDNPPEMGIARFGDMPPASPFPAGILARHRSRVAHKLPCGREAREFSDLGGDRHSRHHGDSAQGLERGDDFPHRLRRRLHRLIDETLQPLDSLPAMLDLVYIVLKSPLLCFLFELDFCLDPLEMCLRPGPHFLGWSSPLT